MAVFFHSEGIDFKLKGKNDLKKWIYNTIINEERVTGLINIIFVNDEHLFRLNKDFLSHHTFTDIITFDYSDKNKLSGDIFISIDRIKDNAPDYQVHFITELMRVIIHGVLHLCGYRDKSKSDKLIMRQKEDFYLSLCPYNFNGFT